MFMNEQLLQPAIKEGKTGVSGTSCLIFENGVEIELKSTMKTPGEVEVVRSNGRKEMHLPVIGASSKQNLIDLVKVHFLPKTSLADRANDPDEVAESEKSKIMLECVEGFIQMAQAFKDDLVNIESLHPQRDYFLYVDTNPQLVALLRTRCGFTAAVGGTHAWIKKSEFCSDENIQRMKQEYQRMIGALKSRKDRK